MSGLHFRMDRTGYAKALMHAAAADSLNDAAEFLLDDANQGVPIEEGILEGSGDVGEASASDLRATVGYGGEASAYAIKQHEDTTLRHDAGRRAKWLEMSFKENASRVQGWLADTIRARFP